MTRLTTLYSQVYVTAAILCFTATLLPLWSSREVESFDSMNLWAGAMISNTGGEIAGVGLMLALLLIVLLVLSALFVERAPVAPAIAAVLSLPGVVLLLTKPYSSTPEPNLGTGGATMLALSFVVILTAIAHAWTWMLGRDEQSAYQGAPTALPAPPTA